MDLSFGLNWKVRNALFGVINIDLGEIRDE